MTAVMSVDGTGVGAAGAASGSGPVVVRAEMPAAMEQARVEDVERRRVHRRVWGGVWPWLVGFAVACGWDRAVWLAVSHGGRPSLAWLKEVGTYSGVGAAVRSGRVAEALAGLGYLGVYEFGRMILWTVVAAVIIFRRWGNADTAVVNAALKRGLWVFCVPAAAGLAAEALKVVGRLRPDGTDGYYVFRPLVGLGVGEKGVGSGLASSHAAVAVAAALAVGAVWPRWRGWLVGVAALTCLSRVAVGAHFLSDVVAGVALGWMAYRGGRGVFWRGAYASGPAPGPVSEGVPGAAAAAA